jgi:hypothetical protein
VDVMVLAIEIQLGHANSMKIWNKNEGTVRRVKNVERWQQREICFTANHHDTQRTFYSQLFRGRKAGLGQDQGIDWMDVEFYFLDVTFHF